MPAAKKDTCDDEIVFLAIRIPKAMKRELQQVALDEESTIQALVRSAIARDLRNRVPQSTSARISRS